MMTRIRCAPLQLSIIWLDIILGHRPFDLKDIPPMAGGNTRSPPGVIRPNLSQTIVLRTNTHTCCVHVADSMMIYVTSLIEVS
jgi:hypothetical protein